MENKYERALENVRAEWGTSDHDIDILDELVERATDKTVKWELGYEDGYGLHTIYIECPKCGYSFTDDEIDRKVNYCPECGQSLKWEEYDE